MPQNDNQGFGQTLFLQEVGSGKRPWLVLYYSHQRYFLYCGTLFVMMSSRCGKYAQYFRTAILYMSSLLILLRYYSQGFYDYTFYCTCNFWLLSVWALQNYQSNRRKTYGIVLMNYTRVVIIITITLTLSPFLAILHYC